MADEENTTPQPEETQPQDEQSQGQAPDETSEPVEAEPPSEPEAAAASEPAAEAETPTEAAADPTAEAEPPSEPAGEADAGAGTQPAETPAADAAAEGSGGDIGQAELDALMAEMNQAGQEAADAVSESTEAVAAGDAADGVDDGGVIDQSELDAIVAGASGGQQPVQENAASGGNGLTIDQAELDAMMGVTSNSTPANDASEADVAGEDDIMAEMAAAIEAEKAAQSAGGGNGQAAAAQPATPASPAAPAQPHVMGGAVPGVPADAAQDFPLPELQSLERDDDAQGIDLLDDVELNVKIELGRTEMYVEDVLQLGQGSVVELNKLAGDPVDIYVNEQLIAKGEVLVLNDNFCVRINAIISPVPELNAAG